eukprot:TRINITY_DN28410_c0_g1_i1.p1 TRINITY_DN28410_c0_g1~~TRINITY_DN28410_c0_g1_i1.p1  ORF type:complete len:720 (+),score=80.71 TRINITY_DN28410_c0_g1_i1:42-2162(+)
MIEIRLILSATCVILHHACASGGPKLGFNNCNIGCCSDTMPSSAFMRRTAELMVSRGFRDAGYEYVNMDDCWMEKERANGGVGPQVPIASKFPEGMNNLSANIHSLGMKFGLYTASGKSTCAGKAGSCGFEKIDAEQYAAWGVDYLKEDWCGGCTGDDTSDYGKMQEALVATGRDIYHTLEGSPNISLVSAHPNRYGGSHRVAHDIMATWFSVLSEVDAASGLHHFVHADNGYGSFYNDLDMLEVGNPGDFETDLDRIRVHFTMWVVLKSNLLLGTHIDALSDDIVSILTNKEAIRIHQDPLGKQARRVNSLPPLALELSAPLDAQLALRRCDASNPLQKWTLDPDGKLWTSTGERGSTRWCVGPTSIPWGRPYNVLPCDDPRYQLNTSRDCDVPNVCNEIASWKAGPLECWGGVPIPKQCGNSMLGGMVGERCKLTLQCQEGEVIDGIAFADWGFPNAVGADPLSPDTCAFASNTSCTSASNAKFTKFIHDLCVGKKSCTINTGDFKYVFDPCRGTHKRFAIRATGCSPKPVPPQPQYTMFESSTGAGTLAYDNDQFASGPLPHSRYMMSGNYDFGQFHFEQGAEASEIRAAPNIVYDNDHLGGITVQDASEWCVEAIRGGNLEVWVAELERGQHVVALLNRSPYAAFMNVTLSDLGVNDDVEFAVRDVWAATDKGTFHQTYGSKVPAHGVVLLVLKPVELIYHV